MFKTETHLHVAEVSPCAKLCAEDMIKLYYEAGYKTVFVTDHFQQNVIEPLGTIPWKDKVSAFIAGYENAKKAGEKYGMNILLSAEFAFADDPHHNHYLAYGITREFLCKCEGIIYKDICALSALAKENGVFLVQAHPYRDGVCVPTPEFVDGIEVYNSNSRHSDFTEKSYSVAKENSLYMSAGSDAHRVEDVACSGIASETEIKSSEDFIELIKSGNAHIITGENR